MRLRAIRNDVLVDDIQVVNPFPVSDVIAIPDDLRQVEEGICTGRLVSCGIGVGQNINTTLRNGDRVLFLEFSGKQFAGEEFGLTGNACFLKENAILGIVEKED